MSAYTCESSLVAAQQVSISGLKIEKRLGKLILCKCFNVLS